ncbi:MAG: histidinol-phosphate transaminase [Planctomycetales bacterium]|nr:histidinol-phosphate transaminase [Planctomycetales bacterium]
MYFRPEIEAMSGYVPGEQPQAGKFIKLNTNENPYPPSPKAIKAICDAAQTSLVRYPDPLATSFRLRAADVLGVDPNGILCGNGSDDILTICTRALVGDGQWLRLPHPSYVLYKTLAEIQGAESEEIPFEPDWSLGDAFSAESANLQLAFLPNPNSPSGSVLPPARILELADALPCPLLVDEAYVDFAETNCLKLVAENEKIMVSRTLSKSYALAGLRFGFLVAQPQMVEQLRKVKDSYNCDALAIAGATAAIDDQTWLTDNVRKVVATRARLTAAMRQFGFVVPDSQANFVWCMWPGRELRPIYQDLKDRRILVRYMNYDGFGEGIRVSVGTDDQIDALVATLQSIL